jgi:hypothetical protein
LEGTWRGDISDGSAAYPVTLRLGACSVGTACGESEYEDPASPGTALCAAELTLESVDPDGFRLAEAMTWHPWQCLATVLLVLPPTGDAIDVKALMPGESSAFASGRLTRVAPAADVTPPPSIPGLGRPTIVVRPGGTTTQYGAAGFGSIWVPLDDLGEVARLDAATGAVLARIPVGDPSLGERHADPHGLAVSDDGVWVTSAAGLAIELIDPGANAVIRTVPLGVAPYALAVDAARAWVTSFDDDQVLAVDLETGKVTARAPVAAPTGIAVAGDSVWVVAHRTNTVERLDAASLEARDRVEIESGGTHPVCGFCVENIVAAEGSLWTADNHRRTVTRIDAESGRVTATIRLPMRVWGVAAGSGRIWAGQFSADADDRPTDPDTWKLAEIDPVTGAVTIHHVPAFAPLAADGAVWLVTPGRRGDRLTRVQLDPGRG